MTHKIITVENENDVGGRVDQFLAQACSISRTQIQHWIETGCVIHGTQLLTSTKQRVQINDVFHITPPEIQDGDPQPEAIELDIVFEDDHVIVINKAAGMVVHPAPGHYTGTLVNALLAHCGDSLSGIGGVRRPGIVHRLDKDTSGLMVVAKHDAAHQALSAQFSAHQTKTLIREYVAFVWGVLYPKTGTIDLPIARHPHDRQRMSVQTTSNQARRACTHYTVQNVWTFDVKEKLGVSKITCVLETGRTHQIRVHFGHLKYPIVGDPVYGKKNISARFPIELREFPRQALHAQKLSFIHPHTQEIMVFEAPLPADLMNLEESFI